MLGGGGWSLRRLPPGLDEKWIAAALLANRRRRTVAREHRRVVAEREEDPANRIDQGRVIAAGQIGAADRSGKQGVADEKQIGRASCRERAGREAGGGCVGEDG